MVTRGQLTEAAIGILLGAVAIVAVAPRVTSFLPHEQTYPYIPVVNEIGVPSAAYAPGAADTPGAAVSSIPVVAWHQMDNGCAATATRCTAADFSDTNVTQRQFYDQLSWLYTRGYRTITAAQYVKWATGRPVMLPARPVLLTTDDGIANFYAGATPVLRHFGYTMVSMIVSGFVQGAQDNVRAYEGWDATWTQLRSLPSKTWEFGFHAGPAGHLLSSGGCPFYPCQRAGEPAAAYRARVARDVAAGLSDERHQLGPRIDTQMWAVPFNDLAQDPDQRQSGPCPRAWLENFAASRFAVVFVDGYTSRANQHYRYEVHGTDTLAYFASQVQRTDVFLRLSGPATAEVRAGGQS